MHKKRQLHVAPFHARVMLQQGQSNSSAKLLQKNELHSRVDEFGASLIPLSPQATFSQHLKNDFNTKDWFAYQAVSSLVR